jgi:Uma2 family endonuclease
VDPVYTVADLATAIGGIPLSRVCFSPVPGTATQEDLIRLNDDEGHHYELIHGTLVEKALGSWEGFLATWIATQFHIYLMSNEIGAAFGDNVPLVFSPQLVYIPDAGFISASRLSAGKPPEERPLLEMVPNLAVEVISVSNTRREMERKLESYFSCGVEEVWYVYPKLLQVYQFVAGQEPRILGMDGALISDLLPGFSLAVKTLFSPPGFQPK